MGERREEKFWEYWRSLRLWPVPGADCAGLVTFLKEKLRMDESFLNDDLGEVATKPHRDPRSKIPDEIIVRFETKEIRDAAIKANASNLTNFRETNGMRLHLPNHLQKDFKSLMGLSYDLKKIHALLKRNVKFDEDELGLYMDIQLNKDAPWRRVKPEQARKALASAGTRKSGPAPIDDDELSDLLGSDQASE